MNNFITIIKKRIEIAMLLFIEIEMLANFPNNLMKHLWFHLIFSINFILFLYYFFNN